MHTFAKYHDDWPMETLYTWSFILKKIAFNVTVLGKLRPHL